MALNYGYQTPISVFIAHAAFGAIWAHFITCTNTTVPLPRPSDDEEFNHGESNESIARS